jgi:hypothetical protein
MERECRFNACHRPSPAGLKLHVWTKTSKLYGNAVPVHFPWAQGNQLAKLWSNSYTSSNLLMKLFVLLLWWWSCCLWKPFFRDREKDRRGRLNLTNIVLMNQGADFAQIWWKYNIVNDVPELETFSLYICVCVCVCACVCMCVCVRERERERKVKLSL